METDWEKFLKTYNEAPTELQKIIDSPQIPELVTDFISKYNLPKTKRSVVTSLISDVVLGITRLRAAEEMFRTDKELAGTAITKIIPAIQVFIKKIRETPPEKETLKQERVTENAEWGVPKELGTLEKEEAPVTENGINPEDLEKVTPIRTMEADAKRIHGYGAYRESNPHPEGAPQNSSEEPVYNSSQESVLTHKPITKMPTYSSTSAKKSEEPSTPESK